MEIFNSTSEVSISGASIGEASSLTINQLYQENAKMENREITHTSSKCRSGFPTAMIETGKFLLHLQAIRFQIPIIKKQNFPISNFLISGVSVSQFRFFKQKEFLWEKK